MSTIRTTQTTRVDVRDPSAHGAVGGHRYRLLRPLTTGGADDLWRAHDTRLGREVTVHHCDHPDRAAHAVRRLADFHLPGMAPLLDAGAERSADGRVRFSCVYPATDWPSLADISPGRWSEAGVQVAATVAAWLIATSLRLHLVSGANVALRTSDVAVDPGVFARVCPTDRCPVQWMPALGADGDGVADAVQTLSNATLRATARSRRRWAAAVAPLDGLHGRPGAAHAMAAIAGLDPHVIGLPEGIRRHAAPRSRRLERHLVTGTVPATRREELSCESV